MHIGLRQQPEPNYAEIDPTIGLESMHPPQLHDTKESMEWNRECQHAIDRQGVRYAIAPRCRITAPLSGLVLTAGAEIVEGRDATIGQIQILERRGVVLRATPEGMRVAACPVDARWIVAPGQCISSTEGQLLAGAQVLPHLVSGEQSLISLVLRGVVLDRRAEAPPKLVEEVTLSLREIDLENAKAAVAAAIMALAVSDDESTQSAFTAAKIKLDLEAARVEAAKKVLDQARGAEAELKRVELLRQIEELDKQIKAQVDEALPRRAARTRAALALAAAMREVHDHEDRAYQIRVRRNALMAELDGGEMKFENPPLNFLQKQLAELERVIGVSLTGAR